MSVDWSLAGRGFDAMEVLRTAGETQTRELQNQSAKQKLADLGMQRQARPIIQQKIAAGDYRGAQAAAIGAVDNDTVKAIGGLAEDQRKELAAQGDLMGRAAVSLKQVPVEQRPTVYAGMVPRLKAMGFGHDDLTAMQDFSDESLDRFVTMSQSIKDHLATQYTQARIDDVGYDNERADDLAHNTIRNTDNVIADRTERRQLTARGQNLADARGRHGIDVASADRRRGQDQAQDRFNHRPASAGRPASVGRQGAVRVTSPEPERALQPGTVRVTSREQARALPPGTVFVTPDGQRKVR